MPTPFSPATLAILQASFLAIVLPRVLSHGRVYFRNIRCRHRREDAIQEMIDLTWMWHLRLAEKGKDSTLFPTALASYAARAVKSGCRFCGQERAKDVLSPLAQQGQHFAVEKLPDFSTLNGSPLEEALHDNTVSPVPDQVAFRLDFPAWLGTLGPRNRSMAEDMALGEKTQDLAQKYRVSEGRISQMRRYFQQDWGRFCGDAGGQAPPNA
jgi:formate dehydrogenase assembly factor FdhD